MMETELITLETSAGDAEKLRHAARVLQSGGLVAFPTETVYGLGVNADDAQAMDRLYRVKGRPQAKPLAYHLADSAATNELAAPLERVTRKLIRLYWPGPLTLVVPAPMGGYVGLRMPEHPVARRLLGTVEVPVKATSANRSGQSEPRSADAVLKQLGGQIDLVLDAGRLADSLPSTVVQVDADDIQVLRSGVIPEDELINAARMTLLFVCRGNTCRSPMAAALCQRELQARGKSDLVVLSAGMAALGGEKVSAQAIQVMCSNGLNIESHLAQPLTVELVDRADRIYVMERSQRRSILELVPGADDRLALLDPSGRDIADPHGGAPSDYNLCRGELVACIKEVLATL